MSTSVSTLTRSLIWLACLLVFVFIESCRVVYVVEQNMEGQLKQLLMSQGASAQKLIGFRRYDGVPPLVGDLVNEVMHQQDNHIESEYSTEDRAHG